MRPFEKFSAITGRKTPAEITIFVTARTRIVKWKSKRIAILVLAATKIVGGEVGCIAILVVAVTKIVSGYGGGFLWVKKSETMFGVFRLWVLGVFQFYFLLIRLVFRGD